MFLEAHSVPLGNTHHGDIGRNRWTKSPEGRAMPP
jgi:hypothetical protein